MELLARLFLLEQVFYLSFKFCTETAGCATVFGLHFKIALLLINSLRRPCRLSAKMCRPLRKAVERCWMLCEMMEANWFHMSDAGFLCNWNRLYCMSHLGGFPVKG